MNCFITTKGFVGGLVVSISLIWLNSCNPDNGYYQFYDVPTQGWSWDDSVVFVLSSGGKAEAIQTDNLNVSVRIIDGDYLYQNIILLFSGDRATDTIRMPLQDTKGQWLGNCNAGVCEVTMKLESLNPVLRDVDTLVVQQWSRDASLQGIVSLGLFKSK